MSVERDPFGLGGDASRETGTGPGEDRGRTRIRPPPRAAAAPPPRMGSGSAPIRGRDHPNPLIGAFAGLLAIAPELEAARAPADPEFLRARLLDGLIAAREAATSAGALALRADQAAWAVAALLDDLALNTPWGGGSEWPRQPLVSTLYGDVDAGARFFDRLEDLERHPSRDPDMLWLFVACLSLGFRGKHRVPGRAGARSIAQVRAAAARLALDPAAERAPLSPNWQGVVAADHPRRNGPPLWSMFALAAVAAAALHLLLGMRLDGQAERLAAIAERLPPPEQAEIIRTARGIAPAEVGPPVAPVDFALAPALAAAAPAGLRPALHDPKETTSLVAFVVQWTDPELFRSGKAELTEGFGALFTALGGAIAEYGDLIGGVTVIGHTDSVPLNVNEPFASNERLSLARAETVRDLLAAGGAPAALIRVEGRGDREPAASNASRQGRALNRRIEILVEKRL